jgi:hypothetical protein
MTRNAVTVVAADRPLLRDRRPSPVMASGTWPAEPPIRKGLACRDGALSVLNSSGAELSGAATCSEFDNALGDARFSAVGAAAATGRITTTLFAHS